MVSTNIDHDEPNNLVICISVRPIQVDSVSFGHKTWPRQSNPPCKEVPSKTDELSQIRSHIFINSNPRLFWCFNNCGIHYFHQFRSQIIQKFYQSGANLWNCPLLGILHCVLNYIFEAEKKAYRFVSSFFLRLEEKIVLSYIYDPLSSFLYMCDCQLIILVR